MSKVTRADFIAAVGRDVTANRVERDVGYLYECFDNAEGKELGFISWHEGAPSYFVHAEPQAQQVAE